MQSICSSSGSHKQARANSHLFLPMLEGTVCWNPVTQLRAKKGATLLLRRGRVNLLLSAVAYAPYCTITPLPYCVVWHLTMCPIRERISATWPKDYSSKKKSWSTVTGPHCSSWIWGLTIGWIFLYSTLELDLPGRLNSEILCQNFLEANWKSYSITFLNKFLPVPICCCRRAPRPTKTERPASLPWRYS